MTPQEIAEYKQQWMSKGGASVIVHTDIDVPGKDWCRRNLERQQWSFSTYTSAFEHTFWFETLSDAVRFKNQFNGKIG